MARLLGAGSRLIYLAAMTDKLRHAMRQRSLRRRAVHIVLLVVATSTVFSNTLDNTYHLA